MVTKNSFVLSAALNDLQTIGTHVDPDLDALHAAALCILHGGLNPFKCKFPIDGYERTGYLYFTPPNYAGAVPIDDDNNVCGLMLDIVGEGHKEHPERYLKGAEGPNGELYSSVHLVWRACDGFYPNIEDLMKYVDWHDAYGDAYINRFEGVHKSHLDMAHQADAVRFYRADKNCQSWFQAQHRENAKRARAGSGEKPKKVIGFHLLPDCNYYSFPYDAAKPRPEDGRMVYLYTAFMWGRILASNTDRKELIRQMKPWVKKLRKAMFADGEDRVYWGPLLQYMDMAEQGIDPWQAVQDDDFKSMMHVSDLVFELASRFEAVKKGWFNAYLPGESSEDRMDIIIEWLAHGLLGNQQAHEQARQMMLKHYAEGVHFYHNGRKLASMLHINAAGDVAGDFYYEKLEEGESKQPVQPDVALVKRDLDWAHKHLPEEVRKDMPLYKYNHMLHHVLTREIGVRVIVRRASPISWVLVRASGEQRFRVDDHIYEWIKTNHLNDTTRIFKHSGGWCLMFNSRRVFDPNCPPSTVSMRRLAEVASKHVHACLSATTAA